MSPEPLSLDQSPAAYQALHGLLDEPTVDLALTAREREVRELTRDLVAREVAPRAATIDEQHAFAHESVQALAAAGLCGLLFPEELGGSGDSNVAYAVAMEEIAAGCASTSLIFMTQMHAAYPILIAGSDDLRHRYIPGLVNGSLYGSLAITEPEAGSDVSSIATTATPRGDGWSLSGQKTFITSGDRADVIVCFATVDRTLGRRGITALVVESTWDGVASGRPFEKMGMHGSSTAELFFDHVQVPGSNLLGAAGDGWSVVMRSVVKSRISAAAQGVGLARAAYARTVEILRRVYDGPLPGGTIAELADVRTRVLQARLLLHATARHADLGSRITPAEIGMMKKACTDAGFDVSLACVRLLGPYGDLADLGVERCLRDAKVTQIYDGTNEIQQLLIGRDIAQRIGGLE